MSTPNDPLYAKQWHFSLIGDIETIWRDFTGRDVLVGVYDDGVQITHPDLSGNHDRSANYFYDNPETPASALIEHLGAPAGSDHDHGTAVGGLVFAAADNRIGGVGVAHGASFGSVNIFEFFEAQADAEDRGRFALGEKWFAVYLDSLSHAQNYDIMSNSWGNDPEYRNFQSIHKNGSDVTKELARFETVVEQGRDGLGTVIVQAAGNEELNSNGDGLNASRFTITVAATDFTGYAADYTNYGAGILLTAPDSAVTTDRTGNRGYNDGSESVPKDYTDSFNGTSAATPTVSGVIALMLDANPGLGWRDVQNILSLSAAQTGENLNGKQSGDYEIGDWEVFDAGTAYSWNGGGTTFHASYCFGMLDAFAAVRMAESWFTMFDGPQTSANEQTVSLNYSGSGASIPDNKAGGATLSATTTKDITIENAQVTVTLRHSYAPDLEIFLVTPDGVKIPLFENEGRVGMMKNGFTWTFEVTGLLGQSTVGAWSILAIDSEAGDKGRIDDFEIDFFGSRATADTAHFITHDFEDAVDFERARATISDRDGGNDWLNVVAVNSDGAGDGDVDVNLFAGARDFFVDGDLWGRTAGGIENVLSGDGDDKIRGTGTANELHGMRGDDRILGMAGKDEIYGGAGGDVLVGGRGNDLVNGDGGFDRLEGQDGFDVVKGGSGDDLILGQIGNDFLAGNTGNDRIMGGAGRDKINGGRGDDEVNGGRGEDTFLFRQDIGSDKINDYRINRDALRFDVALWASESAAPRDADELIDEYASIRDNDIVFDFGAGNSVVLSGALLRGSFDDLAEDIMLI